MDLDKKMSLLKEEFAKKQVEIKEVALKKPSSNSDPSPLVFIFYVVCYSNSTWFSGLSLSQLLTCLFCISSHPESSSSKQQHDGESLGKGTESSPDTASAPSSQSHRHNQTLKKHLVLLNNSKHNSLSSLPAPLPTGNNHNSRTSPPALVKSIKHRRPSHSVSPPPLKKRQTSPFSNHVHSPPFFKKKFNSEKLSRPAHSISPLSNMRGQSDNNRPSRPVISPIRLASSGDSYSDTSPPSPPRENGLPEQYRRNFNKTYSNKNHHHRRHRHHHRHSSKAYQEKYQHHLQEEVGCGSRRSQMHLKSRRTEHDHFR